MIKEHVYADAAAEFGTSVGVAHVIGYKNKREQIREEGVESFKEIEPDIILYACHSIVKIIFSQAIWDK